jgi:hypothetical protein
MKRCNNNVNDVERAIERCNKTHPMIVLVVPRALQPNSSYLTTSSYSIAEEAGLKPLMRKLPEGPYPVWFHDYYRYY